jgi:hypothetical protein
MVVEVGATVMGFYYCGYELIYSILELIHNTGNISDVLQCVFLLMKCIVGFINYFLYMPMNICLGILDHILTLCYWLDLVEYGRMSASV